MASQPPSVAAAPKNNVAAPATKQRVPPEEQFWERYSPHHEAPLSGIGSFAVHFLIAGFLILAGYLGWLGLGSHRSSLPTDVVRFDPGEGGGGGSRSASGDAAGTPANSQEVADNDSNAEPDPGRPDQGGTPGPSRTRPSRLRSSAAGFD